MAERCARILSMRARVGELLQNMIFIQPPSASDITTTTQLPDSDSAQKSTRSSLLSFGGKYRIWKM